MDNSTDKNRKSLDELWNRYEKEKRIEKDEEGNYISLENEAIDRMGLRVPQYNAPGSLESFQIDTGVDHQYFGRPMSENKTRLFRRPISG